MAHSYRKDGPVVDSFTFNPNTRIMTVGNLTYTFPVTDSTVATVALVEDSIDAVELQIDALIIGNGFNLPTADPMADVGRLWNDAGTVKVSAGA